MPYKMVYIGDGEEVISRVSEEVVSEWLTLREKNKELGYPDRPPDIDTPLFRTWISHPHETNTTFSEERVEKSAKASFMCYSASTSYLGVVEAKFLVTYDENRGYIYRLVARSELTGETFLNIVRKSKDWDEDIFERGLKLYALTFLPDDNSVVLIATYFDFLEVEQEVDLAHKELSEYYKIQENHSS